MGLFDIFKKFPQFESDFYLGCDVAEGVELIKTKGHGKFGVGCYTATLTKEMSLAFGGVILEFNVGLAKENAKYFYNVSPINASACKVHLKVKVDTGNAKFLYNNIFKYLDKFKHCDKSALTAPAAPVAPAEDYSKLSLEELLKKFESKLAVFGDTVNQANFAPLAEMCKYIKEAIMKCDTQKKAALNKEYSTIEMYINTLKSQFSGPSAAMVGQFAATYVSQMNTAVINMQAAL